MPRVDGYGRRNFLKLLSATSLSSISTAKELLGQYGFPSTEQTHSSLSICFDREEEIGIFVRGTGEQNQSIVEKPNSSGNALEIRIPEGSHYGTSLKYFFERNDLPEPEELWAEFDIFFPNDFEVYGEGGKLPGAGGLYLDEPWGAPRPVYRPDGTNGWFAYGSHYEGDEPNTSKLGYYVYHKDIDWPYGDHFQWDGNLQWGTWHHIQQHFKVNTPGQPDGVLQGWVDGEKVFDKTDFVFRNDGHDHIKIENYWFLVYWGGTWTSPAENRVYIDNLGIFW